MLKSKWFIMTFIGALICCESYSQHLKGEYTIENINQIDHSLKKQGYWEIWVDSSLNQVEKGSHSFGYLGYYYNDELIIGDLSDLQTNKHEVKYNIIDLSPKKIILEGDIQLLSKNSNQLSYQFTFSNSLLVEFLIENKKQNYYNDARYDKKMKNNSASYYLKVNEYGHKLIQGYIEYVGKKKMVRHFEKTKLP